MKAIGNDELELSEEESETSKEDDESENISEEESEKSEEDDESVELEERENKKVKKSTKTTTLSSDENKIGSLKNSEVIPKNEVEKMFTQLIQNFKFSTQLEARQIKKKISKVIQKDLIYYSY